VAVPSEMATATAITTESPEPSVLAAGVRALGSGGVGRTLSRGGSSLRGRGRVLSGGGRALGQGAVGADADQTLSEGELRAWLGLKRAHASLAKRVEAELERTHGLPLSTYEVLHQLVESPGCRMRMCDLAEQAQLSRSGLTRLVDRLEKEGLLERCSCEHDARGAYACLTELGRERLCAARGTHLAVVREQFLSRFSEEELGALVELWERIAPCGGGCRLA
jgi:DNA-binding MarR family transcriptional regulator